MDFGDLMGVYLRFRDFMGISMHSWGRGVFGVSRAFLKGSQKLINIEGYFNEISEISVAF